jgi:hypothetical protein
VTTRKNTSGKGRSWLAGILLAIATLLLPTAIVGHWATVQITNSSQFVNSLSPLASNPAVQQLVTDKLATAVDDAIHIDDTTKNLVDGLGTALNLPPKLQESLNLLSTPIASGVQGLIHDTIAKVVAGPAFQKAWTATLTLTQKQVIAILSNDPTTAVQIANDGTVSLSLKPLMAEVKQQLEAAKVPFAKAIPEINASIEIAKIPDITTARVIYQVGTGVGNTLPWIVAAIFGAAILIARRHWRQVFISGIAIFAITGIVAIGLAFGRVILSATLTADISQVAGIVYDSIVAYVATVVAGTLALGLVMILAGALFGLKSTAGVRAWFARGFGFARKSMDDFGVNTGAFGNVLWKYRVPTRIAVVGIAGLFVAFVEPISAPGVLWTAALVAGILVVLELLDRPVVEAAKPAAAKATPARTAAAKPAAKPAARPAAKPAAKKPASTKPTSTTKK